MHRFLNKLLYGGLEKEEYYLIKNDIYYKNAKTLLVMSFLFLCVFGTLFYLSTFASFMNDAMLLYRFISFGSLIICIADIFCLKYNHKIAMFLLYALYLLAMTYAISLNILHAVIYLQLQFVWFCLRHHLLFLINQLDYL